MKKTLLSFAMIVAAATMSHGAAIKWAIGGLIDSSATIDTSVGSFVLAYIGVTSDGAGVDAATFTTGVGSAYTIKQTAKWEDFFVDGRGYSKMQTLNTTSDNSGDTYQVFYVNNGNYNLINDSIATIMVSVDGAGSASTAPYYDGVKGSGAAVYATGGARNTITSVPEPSVALMGLLGLGMLLKRRRA